jgi:hypothetical protein
MRSAVVLGLCLLPLGGGALAQAKPAGSTVIVYRCTDASGKQSLRDTPCPKGQKQQAREMQRPQDAPPRPKPAPVPPAPAALAPPAQRTVYLAPPRPMYECTTADGDRYTSDDGAGNPRWVPLWTLGYHAVGRPSRGFGTDHVRPTPQPGTPMRPPSGRPHWPMAVGGGTWVRDQCAMLPPPETCARLRDRRGAVRTRFFNAQEKERDVLRLEERAINARLDNDCGGR